MTARGARALTTLVVFVAVLLVAIKSPAPAGGSAPRKYADSVSASQVPSFAYFYIWFDPTSWNRAKTDYPLVGRYSSDERTVMLEQVQLAKQAGLRGFIVSWKSTPKLNSRLQMLADISAANDFKLIVIYQGLDFDRKPLAAARVAADLDYFVENFAAHSAFQFFSKPAVILSGSWEFRRADVLAFGGGRRDTILLLSSEKNVDGIERLSGLVDGNAYYWSSANPDTYPGYQQKLDTMARAVRQDGGLWIAPAAAGFDARQVGGTSVVEREHGNTLRRQYAAAISSHPDAIGVISWNEFSENSYIEPSRKYGEAYVKVLAELIGAQSGDGSANFDEFDSSAPADRGSGSGQAISLAIVFAMIIVATLAVIRRRRQGSGAVPSG
jgi:hypothetical protein